MAINNQIYICILIFVSGCKEQGEFSGTLQNNHKPTVENIKSETNSDTIFFDYFLENDSTPIPMVTLQRAIQEYPDLLNDRFPDAERMFTKTCEPDTIDSEMTSYQNQIYTYLLRKKNNKPEHQATREKLMGLFSTINSIYALLAHGGTGFMHMYEDMPAIVEYYVANRDYTPNQYEIPEPDFSEEKKYYIRMIKAMVASRETLDNDLPEDEKRETYKSIYKSIDWLDREITSAYFLMVVRHFQYNKYGMYE